jgi:BT1 family
MSYSLAPTDSDDEYAENNDSVDGDGLNMPPLRRKTSNIAMSSSGRPRSNQEVEMRALSPSSDGVSILDFEQFDDEMLPDGLAISHVTSPLLPQWLEDFLYPPHLPRKCQLLRVENIAVPACYLLVGLMLGLASTLINTYPLDLGATEAQQTSISAVRHLPASFKLIFGFLSDSTPLMGYRRKSYMVSAALASNMHFPCRF